MEDDCSVVKLTETNGSLAWLTYINLTQLITTVNRLITYTLGQKFAHYK